MDFLLLETGDRVLQEQGDGILLSKIAVGAYLTANTARYPDVMREPPGLRAAILAGAFFMGAFTSALVAQPVASGGSRGVQVARLQVQHPSVFGPVFVPTAAAAAPELSWAPIYPDRSLALTRDVDAARQRAFFSGPFLPTFSPDKAAIGAGSVFAFPTQTQYPAIFWPVFVPTAAAAPDLSWGPVYPSQTRALERGFHASEQRAFFRPETPLPAAPALSWQPEYPDFAKGRAPEVSGYYVKPLTEPPDIARLGWRGRAPDLLEHRRPTPSGWYVRPQREPDDIAPRGWRPVYPDRAEGPRGLHASLQDAHFFAPFPITAVDGFAWRGSYPDQIARLDTRHTAPSVFKNPTPLPAAPALSWQPEYPDFAQGRAPEVGGYYVRPLNEPPDIARLGWRGFYPIQLEPRRPVPSGGIAYAPFPVTAVDTFWWRGLWPDVLTRLERQPWLAPSYFKSPLPQPAAPALSWGPVYPSLIEPGRSIRTAAQRAFFFDPFPIAVPTSQFGWRGWWPDLLNRRDTHASQAPAYFKSPLPMPAAPALSWKPVYPDQVWLPRSLGVALHPAFFFYVEPQADEEKFGWRGEWPDYLSRIETHASRVPAYFKSPLPMQAAPPLSWLGRYADKVDPARALLAAQQRFLFFDPFPIAVPTSQFGWRGQWPDVLFRLERRPWLDLGYFKSPLPQPAAPLLSWRGQYADLVWPGRGLHVSGQRSHFFHPFPITAVDAFAWWGEYPDLLSRLERRPWLAPASFFAPYPLAAVPPLSWHPEYPDRIDPARALGVQYQRATFFDPRPFPAVQVGWFGSWPDVLSRLERRPWLDLGYFKSPLPQEAAPPLSWLGQWPVDFARAFTHPSRIPSYFEPTGYGSAQAVPPLAWLPIFPDFARGDTQIRWELFVLNYEPIVVPLPPLPCGVEAHNVTVAFPYADGVLFLTPTASGVMVTIVSATDPTVTPDE